MTKRRVVITGMGAVTAFGTDVEKLWNNVIEGKSCITTIENFDTDGQVVKIAGEIKEKDLNIADYLNPKEAKRMDRHMQLGVIAADKAIQDANLKNTDYDPYKIGVIVSSAAGGLQTFEINHHAMIKRGPTKCSPFTVPMLIVNMTSGKIAERHGFKGINKAIVSACATGTHSIGDSFRMIQYGEADAMVAGGTEAMVTTLGIGAFSALHALSKHNDEPQKASRPYDKDRDGFIMSEASGVVVLEEYEHAKKRGAKIYAEVIGYGQSCDAYDIVAPDPEGKGAEKSMEFALQDAQISPKDVQYINSHGTSTGLGDIAESLAIANIFGDRIQNPDLSVSSTKSMLGHSLGATGAIETILCVKTINTNIIPPTINLDNQDEKVADLDYVPNKAKQKEVKIALSNSFGFGGQNATLIFKEV